MDTSSYLNIWEISDYNTIHDPPNMRNGVFMLDPYPQLLSDETLGTFPTKQILCPHRLPDVGVEILQIHLHGVVHIVSIVMEADNRPRPFHRGAVLLDLIQKHLLDPTLVNQGGKGVSCIDEARAAGPVSRAAYPLPVGQGIPERNVVDASRLVGHQLAF